MSAFIDPRFCSVSVFIVFRSISDSLKLVGDFGFCFNSAPKKCSTGSESSGAVSKLSCVSIVAGVRCSGSGSCSNSGSVRWVDVPHKCSSLNGSNCSVGSVGSPPSKLRLRVFGSSSDDDTLGGLIVPLLREDVFVQGCLAS